MTISFNFSTQAIMKEIYAASALRCITNDPSYRVPPVLTRQSAPALQRLVKDAFAFVVMKFIAHVEACNLNGETASECNDANNGGDMILSVDLRVPAGISTTVMGSMRVAVEHAIAAYSLHIAYIGHDDHASMQYSQIANDEVAHLLQSLSMQHFNSPTITPQY